MKLKNYIYTTLFIINLSTLSFSQNIQSVTYKNYFGRTLILKEDNTFEFNFSFSIYNYCSKGKWSRIKDTIFFTPIILYDTLIYQMPSGMYNIEFAKSKFCSPRTIDKADYYDGTSPAGGQSDNFLPRKLLCIKDKLYNLNNRNKPIKSKTKNNALGITQKKPRYYYKL